MFANNSSSSKPLLNEKIAVLVATGFCEQTLTNIQRALIPLGASMRVVSMDQGLVNGWSGQGWGLSYAVDQLLSEALAADYSALIVPGGQRSLDKLKLTAHTRRFIGGFLDTGKPAMICDDAIDLMIFAQKISGRTVSGPQELQAQAESAGGSWSNDNFCIDGNCMTGNISANVQEATNFLLSHFSLVQAA